jgi:hypothetical protein
MFDKWIKFWQFWTQPSRGRFETEWSAAMVLPSHLFVRWTRCGFMCTLLIEVAGTTVAPPLIRPADTFSLRRRKMLRFIGICAYTCVPEIFLGEGGVMAKEPYGFPRLKDASILYLITGMNLQKDCFW